MDIWQNVIDISKKKDKDADVQRDMTLLFVGSQKTGKTTAIYRFLNRDENPKPTLALEYTFGRQNRSNLLSKDVCNIWELGGGTLFMHLLEVPISLETISNLVVVVMVDLSSPGELLLTLTNLLDSLREQIEHVLSMPEARQQNLRGILADAAIRRFGGNNHPDFDRIQPFFVPLTIVGGKYDIFQNFEPAQRKIICRMLRYFTHINGAYLQFFSSKMENLVNRTRILLGNAAFGTPISHYVSQDYTKPLVIPVGSDTLQQIDGSADSMSISTWKNTYESHFPQVLKKSKVPEDPAKDPNFKEHAIDNLRFQKDSELERIIKDRSWNDIIND